MKQKVRIKTVEQMLLMDGAAFSDGEWWGEPTENIIILNNEPIWSLSYEQYIPNDRIIEIEDSCVYKPLNIVGVYGKNLSPLYHSIYIFKANIASIVDDLNAIRKEIANE